MITMIVFVMVTMLLIVTSRRVILYQSRVKETTSHSLFIVWYCIFKEDGLGETVHHSFRHLLIRDE